MNNTSNRISLYKKRRSKNVRYLHHKMITDSKHIDDKYIGVLFLQTINVKGTLETVPGVYHRLLLNDNIIIGMSAMIQTLLGKKWKEYVQLIAKGQIIDFSSSLEDSYITIKEEKITIISINEDIIEGAKFIYNYFYQTNEGLEEKYSSPKP